jgi:multiple sugar transport system permease protein
VKRPQLHSRGEFWVAYIILGAFGLVTLFPLFIMVSVSLIPSKGLSTALFDLWPKHPRLANYLTMWHYLPIAHFLLNSIIIAMGSTLLALAVGIPA